MVKAPSKAKEPSDDIPFNMALPVTRHVLIPESEDFEYLSSGIDSLDLGFYINWNPKKFSRLLDQLEDCKERAKVKQGLFDCMPDGRKFTHKPTGKAPNYRFHLQFADYHLFIGITNPPACSSNVYVSFNSKALWHKGIAELVRQVCEDIELLGGQITLIQPSRCDLAADFYLAGDLTYELITQFMVSRTRKIHHFGERNVLETFYAGSPGADIQLRIYDKGKEIVKDAKEWFLPIWGREGPDGVWRAEFQLKRPALKEWGIETLDDLMQKLGGLWKYLTGKWFSLRFEDNTKQERRTALPWRKAVQEMPDGFGVLQEIKKPEKDMTVASLDWLLVHIGGCLVSYAARRGAKDILEAVTALFNDLLTYWFDKDFQSELEKRQLRLGNELDLEDDGDEERDESAQPQMYLFGEEFSLPVNQGVSPEMAMRPFERRQNHQTQPHAASVSGRREKRFSPFPKKGGRGV